VFVRLSLFMSQFRGSFRQLYHRVMQWTRPMHHSLLGGTLTDLARSRGELLTENALWLARVAVPKSSPRSWLRTAAMIVACFAVYCEDVVSARVFHPSGVPRPGRPSGATRWSPAKMTIGCGSPWNAASRGSGNFRRLLIRWEHRFSVYRSGFAFAVMLLMTCAEQPPSRARSRRGESREGGVRGTIGSTTLEHDLLRDAPAYS
jgi:hypothetical protein